MGDTTVPATTLDLREQLERIDRDRAETQKLLAEGRKLLAEQAKLFSKAAKLDRDRALAPWQVALTGMGAGAAIFGAAVALMRIIGAP